MSVPTEPVVLDAAFLRDPRRPGRPAVLPAVLPGGTPGWFVVGHAEARASLADPRLVKRSPHPAGTGPFPEALVSHMLAMDPPEHTRLRRLVGRAFTAGAVASLRPRIEQITDDLLSAIPAPGPVDLLTAFAYPLPITVIGELLGVPAEDRADLRMWSESVTSAFTEKTEAHAQALVDYLSGLVERKRAHPSDDPLSTLVHVSDGGDRFTDVELTSMACLLLVAGHETTANLIGTGVRLLVDDPDQLAALRRDPALLPGAVEELLRLSTPTNVATTRFTSEPVRIGGVEIPAGEPVMISLLGANRDPGRFPDPERLDLTRPPGGHLAFGHGIHHCLGAPLARFEARIALRGLLTEFAVIEPVDRPRWRDSMMVHGLRTLEVMVSRRQPR